MTNEMIAKLVEVQARALEKSAQKTFHDTSRQILKGHAAAFYQLAGEIRLRGG